MGLSRRSNGRGEAPIWPGFVDAMTSLLLVLMFVLTIFMVVQFILRETITSQGNELHNLGEQVARLADQLGLARKTNADLKSQIGSLNDQLGASQSALVAAQGKITDFEQQVAALLAQRQAAQGRIADLSGQVKTLSDARDKLKNEQEALALAVAQARKEIDAQSEAARLAAARRAALQSLIDDMHQQMAKNKISLAQALAALDTKTKANADLGQQVSQLTADLTAAQKAKLAEAAAAEALRKKLGDAQQQLSAQETQRLADAAAAEALRQKLKSSQDALTAMTLALEDQRRKAEDTLTLLAAAQAAEKDLSAKLSALQSAQAGNQQKLTEAQKNAALLAVAQSQLAKEKTVSAARARQVELLNQQVAALRSQLQGLQSLLDAAAAKDKANSVQIDSLGSQLNAALAQVAAEQKKRADLEAAARKRLEAQNKDLASYRSEFFGKVRQVIAGLPGVKIVGDRFVFSSEVLFASGSADLSASGKAQIANVVRVLEQVAKQIPPNINWILQVNGYTDSTPLSPNAPYADNWQLSQARALSVVHYMIDTLGFPPDRLAASGYGEYQPVAKGDSPEARAQNRRIELKLTEK